MGVLMIHGVAPGPLLYIEEPELFWGVVISMLIGNVMLVILNVPLIGIFVRLLSIPASMLSPMILVICIIGSYSLNNNIHDVIAMFIAGMCGYLMKKAILDPAPLIVSFVLGKMLESSLHSGLAIGYGSASVFFLRPISAALLACAALVIIISISGDYIHRKFLAKYFPS
jgi:putative tricarboxylic transport membrane protein